MKHVTYSEVANLNQHIQQFKEFVSPVTDDMEMTLSGVHRLVMLDRYSFKDVELKTLSLGDVVVVSMPSSNSKRGIGEVVGLYDDFVEVKLDEEYMEDKPVICLERALIDKPMELYYEQIALRNARGLDGGKMAFRNVLAAQLASQKIVPAGRVIHSAGTAIENTFFNCFVMPAPKDSRDGLAEHRKIVMEIMSRGGGVGTNGSTLRPRNALARGVNGKSSGSVSWLNDLAQLTHLVEQGGSRKGAQMIILNAWHPDVLEFIISKMQNPDILRFIIETIEDEFIIRLAKEKLVYTPFTKLEQSMYEAALVAAAPDVKAHVEKLLKDGGVYSVKNPQFLSGANISVGITHEFMKAVEDDADFTLRFPAVESYSKDEMARYNNEWHNVLNVDDWKDMGFKIKEYRTIKAKKMWELINICATYSAEPGVFFIDSANDMTNAKAYGQQAVSTNPCGGLRLT